MKNSVEPIRILRVIARLNVGGPAIHTILLTKLLSPARFSTTLVTGTVSPSEGDMSYLADEHGVTPYIIPELGREIQWQSDLAALWKLYRVIRRQRPTIVHTHTAKAGMLGRFAAKLAGVPIIVHTFHGHVFHSYFSSRKTQVFLWIERTLARFSDAIITVSPKQLEEILGYGIGRPERVHAIGLGLELQKFVNSEQAQGQLRRELNVSSDVPLIGIVARLVPVKGHTYFLEAAKQVLAKRPDAQFIIAGDGELRAELEEYAMSLGIRRNVHFLGFRRDLPEIYADLDLVVLSSLNEGLPVTLIEAMASGKTVVSAQVGGVSDLITHGNTGFLVPAKNPAAMAEVIVSALALPTNARIEIGMAARASVFPKYHIDTLVKNVEALYDRLVASAV